MKIVNKEYKKLNIDEVRKLKPGTIVMCNSVHSLWIVGLSGMTALNNGCFYQWGGGFPKEDWTEVECELHVL